MGEFQRDEFVRQSAKPDTSTGTLVVAFLALGLLVATVIVRVAADRPHPGPGPVGECGVELPGGKCGVRLPAGDFK